MSEKSVKTGIHSIEVGMPLLAALADSTGQMTLTALAKAAGMTSSKAHKYLVSLIRSGLVMQSVSNGPYDLGPFAAELGFAALRRFDIVELAHAALGELRDRLKMTVSLAVWGDHGPIIVRRAQNRQALQVWAQLGVTLPVLTSASGRVFGAYLDRSLTLGLIKAELAVKNSPAAQAKLRSLADVDAMFAEVRNQGFATVVGYLHAGITSMATPVFDYNNCVVAALALIGMTGELDTTAQGKPARKLQATVAALSRQLGARR